MSTTTAITAGTTVQLLGTYFEGTVTGVAQNYQGVNAYSVKWNGDAGSGMYAEEQLLPL